MKLIVKNILLNLWLSLCKIIPRNKRIILFGSWFGNKFSDNTKILFEYGLKFHKDFNIFWITKNKILLQNMKDLDYPVVYFKSFKGIYLQLRAKYFFSTIGLADFNSKLLGGSLLINLWHGVGIKKINYLLYEKNSDEYKHKLKIDSPYTKNVRQIIATTSSFTTNFFKEAFPNSYDWIELGYPRNDIFYDNTLRPSIIDNPQNKKIILYMPTHRNEGITTMHLSTIFDLYKLQDFCDRNNVLFIVKKHYFHASEKEDFSNYSSIIDITSDNDVDSQILLSQSDLLITDYSSCVFDFLHLDRPIIHYCFDLENYLLNDRDLYLDYFDVITGPVARNFIELYNILDDKLYLDSQYTRKRNEVKNLFFSIQNQNVVSNKYFEYIKKMNEGIIV